MASIEVYRGRAGVLRWRDAWFWHFEQTDDGEISAAEVDDLLEAVRRHRGKRKAPLLVERLHGNGDVLAQLRTFASGTPALVTAIAFCMAAEIRGATNQLVAHFFRHGLSVEIFRNREDAAEWLKAFARD